MKSLKISPENIHDDSNTTINKDATTSLKKKEKIAKEKSKSSKGENYSYGTLGKYHGENQFMASCINPLSTSTLHLGLSMPHLILAASSIYL